MNMDMWTKEQYAGAAALLIFALSGVLSSASYFTRINQSDVPTGTFVGASGVLLFKWLGGPMIGIVGAWSLAADKRHLLQILPAFFPSYSNMVLHIPVHPKSLNDAFRLGQLFLKASANMAPLTEILEEAAQIAGRSVSAEELLALETQIPLLDENRGRVSQILGMFSLINIIWLVSILGLSVLVGPVLWLILKPLRALLVKIWADAVKPILIFLKPVYQYLIYVFAVLLMTEAQRYPRDEYSMTGVMTAVTGIAVFMLGWAYTTLLNKATGGDAELFATLSAMLITLVTAPLAVTLQSSLIGYAAVASLCSTLGFSVWSSELCLCLGFDRTSGLIRTALACLALNLLNMASRVFDMPSQYLAPFSSAIGIFGSSVYFLALLIATNVHSRSNAMYVCSLGLWLAAGEFLGMPGMANVAKVYAALYALNVYGRCPPRSEALKLLWMFGGFGALYALSLFLNRNPELLTALYMGK